MKSMTGYGLGGVETSERAVRVEIKSLNSKGLDLMVRVPRQHSEKEMTLRSQLSATLSRGKVSIWIEIEYRNPDLIRRSYNETLLSSYYREAERLADLLGADKTGLLQTIMQYPDVLQNSTTRGEEEEWALVDNALKMALKEFDNFRAQEGKSLGDEITSYVHTIAGELKKVDGLKDSRIVGIRTSLEERLEELMRDGKLDRTRFEHELLFYAEKLDITEEIVRLDTHLNLFLTTLREDLPGKKLGFISQEMGREINTIGSKGNDAAIQRHVVTMKEELEKIKEQVLNIL